jgi:hypothetical protein
MTEDDVDTIHVSRTGDTIILVKRAAGDWTVNGHKASPTEMTGFFQALADSQPPTVAAESKAVHQRMGVADSGSRKLRIVGKGKPLADLLIGERGRDYQSSYVRKPGEDRVYLYPGRLASFVDRAVDDWRDHRMATVTPEKVARLDIQRRAWRYSLARKDGVWQHAGGKPIDTTAVRRLLDRFNPLTATGFATAAQADSANFRNPDMRVTLLGPSGDSLAALVFDSVSTGYYVKEARDPANVVFRTGVWVADEIAPADSTLKPKS